MSFWSDAGLEPLRQFRWTIEFTGTNITTKTFALKKCDKPKLKVNTVQHKYLNHFFNFPGRVEWEDINMTFAAVEGLSGNLYEILIKAGYQVPYKPADDRQTLAKKLFSSGALGGVTILQLDSTGKNKIETWKLHNPIFTSIQFGALDYGSEEIVEISCGVKYDFAELGGASAPAAP